MISFIRIVAGALTMCTVTMCGKVLFDTRVSEITLDIVYPGTNDTVLPNCGSGQSIDKCNVSCQTLNN